MKMDKDTVIKHQFWFLLGGYLLFWLIAVLWLKFSAPDKIDEAKKGYEKAQKEVKTAQGTAVNKNTFVPPWEQEAAAFDKHKIKIWKNAWDYQAGMFDWPKEWASKYKMTSPQEAISTDDLSRYRRDLYPKEIESLRADAPHWIEPVELLGGFDAIFKPRTKAEWHETPTREECWLAQEDIWVKRELFFIIYDAMARQAIMQPIPIDEKKEPNPDPKNIKARYRFVNKIWEITLHLRSGAKGGLVIGGDSTIKNVHPSGHPLALTSAKGNGVLFNVSQSGVRSRFEVRGEPVNHLETRPLSTDKDGNRLDYEPVQGISWETINQVPILVSLGFDQTNCPIRRLNAIELRQQDCRSFVWSLQPNHPLAELDPVPEDPNKGAEGGGGTTPSMGGGGGGGGSQEQQMKAQQEMMKKMRSGMSGGGGGMGTAQRSEVENPTTNNQFERNRYLQSDKIDKKANPPSRHLPLAVQLIAEQSHMHDILLALANSRLRFQITQVEFHHEKNYMPQTEEEKKEGNKEQTSPGGPGVFNGPTMPNMSGMGGGGGGADMKTRMLQQMQMQQRMQSGATGQNNNMMKQQMQQEMMRRSQGGGMMGGAGGGMMGGAGGPPRGFNPMMMQNMGGAMGAGKKTFLTNAPGARGNLMPTGMGSTTDPKQAQNQPDDNLVELTVYGIATLYRAPDPPKPEEQAGQPGTPAADAAPPQGTPPAGGTAQPAPAAGATPNATTQPGAAAPQNKANPPQGTATPPKAKDAIPPKDAAKAPDAKKTEKPADKQPTPPAGAKR